MIASGATAHPSYQPLAESLCAMYEATAVDGFAPPSSLVSEDVSDALRSRVPKRRYCLLLPLARGLTRLQVHACGNGAGDAGGPVPDLACGPDRHGAALAAAACASGVQGSCAVHGASACKGSLGRVGESQKRPDVIRINHRGDIRNSSLSNKPSQCTQIFLVFFAENSETATCVL